MPSIHDEDKDLLLSKYLDNELDAETRAAVDERLKLDKQWREDLKRLEKNEHITKRVVEVFHEDNEFAHKVLKGIKNQQVKPVLSKTGPMPRISRRSRRIDRSTGWLVRIASVAALVALAVYVVNFYPDKFGSNGSTTASNQNAGVPVRHNSDPNVIVTESLEPIAWPDGTRIWARKGSEIVRISERSLKLLKGEALFHVAPNSEPFKVIGPDGTSAEAHGTRFDVQKVLAGIRIRVAEGYVRVADEKGENAVDAFGGTEVTGDFQIRAFDPRDLAVSWFPTAKQKTVPAISEAIVPPWSQIGGSASHSNTTSVRAPASLLGKKTVFHPYPDAEQTDAPAVGAVVSADGRAYVLRRCGEERNETRLMELRLTGPDRGNWRDIATIPGITNSTPVITPRGLVAVGTSDGILQVFNGRNGGRVCSHEEKGAIHALCSTPSGMLLLSTASGVVALNDYDAAVRWRFNGAGEVKYPVTVLPNGQLCVATTGGKVVFLSQDGKQVGAHVWPEGIADAPVSDGSADDQVLLYSPNGKLALLSAKKGLIAEKTFKKAVRSSPTASGLVGVGSEVIHLDKSTRTKQTITDEIIALAQDGRGDAFAGFVTGVLHLQKVEEGVFKDAAYVALGDGRVVRHGIAIAPMGLIVTTTRGIQIFE